MPESSSNVLNPKGNAVGPLRTRRDVLSVVGNHRTVTVTGAPANDAVTLVEAKSFMRITASTDDTRLTSLIKACQHGIESLIAQKLITQTLTLTLDQFGFLWTDLQFGPVVSVTTVTVSGTLVADTRYQLVNEGEGPVARLVDDAEGLPTPTDNFGAIVIVYATGYGGAADVPDEIKTALLWCVQAAYDDPDATMPRISRNLLQPHLIVGRV